MKILISIVIVLESFEFMFLAWQTPIFKILTIAKINKISA
jgi:hypothetical protein